MSELIKSISMLIFAIDFLMFQHFVVTGFEEVKDLLMDLQGRKDGNKGQNEVNTDEVY